MAATTGGRVGRAGHHGWAVVQGPGEGPFDPARPPLAQRRYGWADGHYSKPCVLRPEDPSRLTIGQHWLTEGPWRVAGWDRSLLLDCPFHPLRLQAFDWWLFTNRRLRSFARYSSSNRTQGIAEADDPARLPPRLSVPAAVQQRWDALQADPRLAPLPDDVLWAMSEVLVNYLPLSADA